METRLIFVLFGLLVAATALADAYKWVDGNGVAHYSDRPQPGAVRIDLSTNGGPTGRRAPRAATTPSANQSGQPLPDSQPFRYESIAVSAPGPEETLWNIGGTLSVSVTLTPALQGAHLLRAYLDGGAPQVVSGQSFVLEEVYRGVHNIQVEVIDQTGKLMIRSAPNRFYVQQNIVNRGGQ